MTAIERKAPGVASEVGMRSGLTQAQLDFVGAAVFDAVMRVLPEIVGKAFAEFLDRNVDGRIRDAIAQSETGVATSVEAALAAAETATMAIGRAAGGSVTQELAEARKTLESLERRLSRHAEHLSSLETRLKRVER